ncbi:MULTISPECIES: hypothetical protein [Vibrio]|uniref:hypothetical protein n=1 Tax=Vibrio TaxID=662 RepID=UPI000E32AAA4|nr:MULTISPECIES: hypothetical protein [Vibrio]TVN08308.1 hypothetical protein FPV63_04500 [Vibrio cholerae]EGR2854785.1 hypothetical protein [Vibrio parahaemolyticus]EGR2987932.1 hypothetical protein [Vibrio parahaemolyticus]EGR5855863.1 hypothetical protein [Vibrio parahaemolyticus]ELA8197404.1 hypothetical protein [Vibrio parahaemolyticus]
MDRTYLSLPLVLDVTKLAQSEIDEIISIFETELKGDYRFSKQSFLSVLDDYLKDSSRPLSFSKAYIYLRKHKLGFNAISCLNNTSDLGGTQISFEQLKEYKQNGALADLLEKYA